MSLHIDMMLTYIKGPKNFIKDILMDPTGDYDSANEDDSESKPVSVLLHLEAVQNR